MSRSSPVSERAPLPARSPTAPTSTPRPAPAVLKAVEATGYERNHLAVGMRSGRSGMLGLVIPDIANPLLGRSRPRRSGSRGGGGGPRSSSSPPTGTAPAKPSTCSALSQVRVEGAILNPVSDGADGFGRFRLPFVLIGSSAERFPDHASVGSDIAQAVQARHGSPASPRPRGPGADPRAQEPPRPRPLPPRRPRPLPRARHATPRS